MAWDAAKNFGVIKVEGNRVRLYYSKDNHHTIVLNDGVVDARWADDAVIITLDNGLVRRYTTVDRYDRV